MPELPEVETVRRGLEDKILGACITAADQRRKDLRVPFPDQMAARLTDRTITALKRRAKYLLIHLDDGAIWVIHLGMSGRMHILEPAQAASYTPQKHDHVIITLNNDLKIIYNDPRRFGMMMLFDEQSLARDKRFNILGPEPLSNDFSGPVLAARLAGKKTSIKQALLDQKIVAGVGNIYACEALFQSQIHPQKIADKITGREAEKLARAIRDVLQRAIESGGSSLKDYRQADGELGYFQHQFSVYDRAGEACPDCTCNIKKTGGIQKIIISGRSSFFCSKKQRS